LRVKGHDVYTPSLTSLAERQHLLSNNVDLIMHIADEVNLLEFKDLHVVILVGHTYGGMVITGVADRATDRIANVFYLDAAYPLNDQSLVDVAGEVILEARKSARVVDCIELVLFPGEDPMEFFGVTDPELIAWMKPKLMPHPWRCFEQNLILNNEERMRQIPVSFSINDVQIDIINDEICDALRDMT
jgi:pimeloyl-ACP methyl ester carboxylesterase